MKRVFLGPLLALLGLALFCVSQVAAGDAAGSDEAGP